MRRNPLARILLGLALGAALLPASASAATIDVDVTADESISNGNCSLREALTAANLNSQAHEPGCTAGNPVLLDVINVPAGTYALTGLAADDDNASGDLDVALPNAGSGGQLVINGETEPDSDVPTTTIDAGNGDRVFHIPDSAVAQSAVTIQQVNLVNGNASGPAEDGGAVSIDDPQANFTLTVSRVLESDAGRNGGGISFDNAAFTAFLSVIQTEFSGNTAGSHGGAIHYGAVANVGASVDRSAFTGNTSNGVGGAIHLDDDSNTELIISNSTFSGNNGGAGGGAIGFLGSGGGIPTASLRFVTVADNRTGGAFGGAFGATSASHNVGLEASIVTGNTAGPTIPSNCAPGGTYVSDGFNLENTDTCNLDPSAPENDLVNTDPLLGPLDTHPGPNATLTTRTHSLPVGSPAIDRIPTSPTDLCDDADDRDQRNVFRPSAPGGLCDIGAFEGPPAPPSTVTPPPPPTLVPTPTATTPPKKCKKGFKLKKGKCKRKKKRKK